MKILVTGAYGQLGRELCRQIGPEAVGIDCDTLDLADGPAILATLARVRPDLVINCAAYTQVDKAEQQPELARAVNATAVAHLVQACRGLDCPLVEISTDYVFCGGDPARRTPYVETDVPSPRGVYAVTKYEGEQAAAQYAKHWIVRTCGLYARASHEQAVNFVRTMLRLGRSRDRLRVVADQHCTPSYVPHVARAILYLAGVNPSQQGATPGPGTGSFFVPGVNDRHAQSASLVGAEKCACPPTAPEGATAGLSSNAAGTPYGLYHVVNGGATTWHEFAAEIFRLAGLTVAVDPITTAEYGAPAPRPAYSVLSTAAYEAAGGPPLPHWRAALTEYFEE